MLAVALVLAGCGDAEPEPTAEEQRAEVVHQLADDLLTETDGALDDDTATCVADELVVAVGVDRLDEIVAAAGDDGDPVLRDEVVDVFASCDALDPLLGD